MKETTLIHFNKSPNLNRLQQDTPPKLNIDPEKLPSQKERGFPIIIFQGLCLTSGV